MGHASPPIIRLPILLLVLLLLAGCDAPASAVVREGLIPVTGGDSLHYRLVGRHADTVVFLAGGPGLGSRYLESGFARLVDHHALLFYDPRGRGPSPAAGQPDSMSLEQDLTDLETLRNNMGLGRLNLVGHQWGAGLALLYALRYPQRVGRIVFLTPMPHSARFHAELQALPHDTAAQAAHMLVRTAHLDSLNPMGYCTGYWGMSFSPLEETDPGVLQRLAPFICDATPDRLRERERQRATLYRSIGAWNWTDSIPNVAVPALVIVGGKVPALLFGGRAWAGRLRNGRMLVAGETPLFPWLEAGAQIDRALDRFFDGGWPEASFVVPGPPDSVIQP